MEKINEIHLIGGVNKHQIDINPMMNWTLLVRISKQIVKVIQTDNNLITIIITSIGMIDFYHSRHQVDIYQRQKNNIC